MSAASRSPVCTHPELSLSALSLHSSEPDWDKSLSDIDPHTSRPSTPATNQDAHTGSHMTPMAARSGKRISQLIRTRRTASEGESEDATELSENERRVLEEELGRWVNSESSPYEEAQWKRGFLGSGKSNAEAESASETRSRSTTVTQTAPQDASSTNPEVAQT